MLFPEIGSPPRATGSDKAPRDRASMIDLWIKTIRDLCARRPHILIFEDIHRADSDTLSLLSCLAEEIAETSLLLVATHRPSPTSSLASKRLAEIHASSRTSTIDLRPLPDHAVEEILQHVKSSRPVPTEFITTLAAGNPFYITHLVKHYLRVQVDHAPDETRDPRIAHGDEIIARVLSDLPPHTHRTLEAAAIIGESFSANLLASILDLSATETLRALDPAERAWVIIQDKTSFRFTHALLREALKSQLAAPRRQSLHLAVAERLKLQADAHTRHAEIAEHLIRALPLANENEALQEATLAGHEASSRFSYASASHHYRQALRIIEQSHEPRTQERCSVMRNLAISTLYSGDRPTARRLLLSAAEIAKSQCIPRELAQCALLLAPDYLTIEVGVYDTELIQLLSEALQDLPQSDRSLRSQLLARLSQAKLWSREPEHAKELADAALELAQPGHDPEALVAALSASAESLHGPALTHERLAVIKKLETCARHARNTPALLLQHTHAIAAHLELGDIRAVRAENEKHRLLAKQTNLPQFRWYPGAIDSMLALLRGELDQSEQIAADYRRLAGNTADANCLQTYATHTLIRAFERDQLRDALSIADEFAAQHRLNYAWPVAVTFLLCESGDLDAAARAVRQFTDEDIESMARIPGASGNLALLSACYAHLGDAHHARMLYPLLAPAGNRCATVGYGIGYIGSLNYYAGLAARAAGDPESAITHFSHAAAQDLERGAISWSSCAAIDLHQTLFALTQDVDRSIQCLTEVGARIQKLQLPRVRRLLHQAVRRIRSADRPDAGPSIGEP